MGLWGPSGSVAAACHTFPRIEIVRVRGHHSFPMGQRFLMLSYFLKQQSHITSHEDIGGADRQEFLQFSQTINP